MLRFECLADRRIILAHVAAGQPIGTSIKPALVRAMFNWSIDAVAIFNQFFCWSFCFSAA